MPETTDPEDILRRIAGLAEEALRQQGVPASVQPLLSEIQQLATIRPGDTPGESDVPRTENQSL